MIETVTVVGANGRMGSSFAGLVAALAGARVYMLARSGAKASEGIQLAIDSVRSEAIRSQLIPRTYDFVEASVASSDWVFESLTEDFDLKGSS